MTTLGVPRWKRAVSRVSFYASLPLLFWALGRSDQSAKKTAPPPAPAPPVAIEADIAEVARAVIADREFSYPVPESLSLIEADAVPPGPAATAFPASRYPTSR